uniref:Putative LAGLIDADG homing endonuclease n=1 Tax=Sykidion marinum TaxID=44573 RepID=A0A1W6EGN2_SYKMA|nr:putative LAGLIDADG homing endonuclease [Pseudoneochloris marina]ARK14546.1 putative LAGLIDADG homing endonuclease [Pseudoneochloris marina]
MDLSDEYALNQIKQKLGGSIKLRSKSRSFRYRLHHKQGMLTIINLLNGNCQNSIRLRQIEKMCNHFDIPMKQPKRLTSNNGWFAGFFDGDGTIDYSFKKDYPQLTISVSNKQAIDCEIFQKIFDGKIQYDSRLNTYKWNLYSYEQILVFQDYVKRYPLRSHKKIRFFLLDKFFKLRKIRAYTHPPESKTYKAWLLFEKEWKEWSLPPNFIEKDTL